MPVRINLLAEAIAEEDLRRRDPVKRSIYGGLLLVGLSLVWFSSIWLTYMVEKQRLNQEDAAIEARSNAYNQVQNNLKKIAELKTRLEDLDKLAAARFLQGSLLNTLQQTYTTNVQLTRLRVDQTYSTSAGVASVTNHFGVIPGRPPGVTEHVVLTMDARDFSPNPGDQVEHYKEALLKQDYFHAALATNGLRLSGISAVQIPSEGKPFVMFSLECRFHDRIP